ncbi:uncharacterized protein LOC131685275 [Topomyia yanbarensis]|uniref:uncharacterized protein LOC131685275 n=1 Tax=Topomyia yanbarensis TaxID=2498891 RepID=UPI00273B2120|nr:uncharacterized protein LOC131685275 [Topomyia yanbarensis]
MAVFCTNVEVQDFHTNILLKILSSKRLLSDHVEILETCLNSLHYKKNDTSFTASKLLVLSTLSGIGTYLLGRKRITWALPLLATSTVSVLCCLSKWTKQFHFKRREKQVVTFIQTLDQFEAAVRKNILFLNECNHVRSAQNAMDNLCSGANNFAANCARCLVETIKIIHGSVKALELEFTLDERWDSLYQPMEDLEDCDLFSTDTAMGQIELKLLKDFYNIFAYVQSQYLTRLALSIVSSADTMLPCSILKLTDEINLQRNQCLKHLNRILDHNRERISYRQTIQTIPAQVTNVRTLSVGLSAKLLNTIHRFNSLEESLENILLNYDEKNFTSRLLTLEAPLEAMANDLLTSTEECQRLLITVKNVLNREDASSLTHPGLLQEVSERNENVSPSQERIYSEQDKPVFEDEFFAVVGTECDVDAEKCKSVGSIDDLELVNSRLVKRHFKPVLEQLRERIEPIGVRFREREKQALLDKGIEWVDLEADEGNTGGKRGTLYDGSESDDEQEDAEREIRKFQKSVQRYDDVRGFLAAKQQTNIFGLKPMTSVVSEDVLE